MGLWDTLTGRSKPVRANLDALFSLPSAAITLQTAAGFTPTGVGSVCYRAAEGAAFAQTQQDVVDRTSSAAPTRSGSPGWWPGRTPTTCRPWSPTCTP